jgi:hypothetical protein
MPKAKQQAAIHRTFKEFLENYDSKTLQSAVIQLEASIGWELLKAFLKQRQREFEIASLDLAGHTGKSQEAAKASGYAQACEDTSDQFMQELVNVVNGIDGYVEGPTREEV